jgi:hypothetical protein
MGSERTTRLLYVSKLSLWSYLIQRFGGDWEGPGGLCLVGYGGLPDRQALDRLLQLARLVRAPVEFVGDIDPVDLSVFLTLSTAARSARGARVRVSYRGFGGQTLEALRSVKDVGSLAWIRMGEFEQALWERLDTPRFDVGRELGAVSLERLREGWKLEGEALLPDLARTPELERQLLSALLTK